MEGSRDQFLDRAIGKQDAIVGFVVHALGDTSLEERLHARPILWMNALEPECLARRLVDERKRSELGGRQGFAPVPDKPKANRDVNEACRPVTYHPW